MITNLGTRSWSEALATNDRGQVVGWTTLTKSGGSHAFLWQDRTIRDLGALPSGNESEAFDINKRGQVVGSATIDRKRFSENTHAVLWQNGKIRDLGVLPGDTRSKALAINDLGQVVGWSRRDDTGKHAFLWQDGRMRRLGTLPHGTASEATAISDRGQVVGWIGVDAGVAGSLSYAVRWQGRTVRKLGMLPDMRDSEATAINDRGQVAGSTVPSLGPWHAFLWENGSVRDLGTFDDGLRNCEATGINERGRIVGLLGRGLEGRPRVRGALCLVQGHDARSAHPADVRSDRGDRHQRAWPSRRLVGRTPCRPLDVQALISC